MKQGSRKFKQGKGIKNMKNLGYLLEYDKKTLANSLLNDAKTEVDFITAIAFKGDLSTKALDFLKSKYCSEVVANSLLFHIKKIVDKYLDLKNPKQDDMATVYHLMFAATMIVVCQCKK